MIFLGDFGGNFLCMLIWSLRGGCLGKVKESNNLEEITCEVVEYVGCENDLQDERVREIRDRKLNEIQ